MKFEVGPVLRRLLQVERPARLLVERAQRQPLVHAEVLDPQCLGLLPERIRDLLVVHPPGLLADLGAGVHLPRLDLQFLDLTLHLLELGLAQVGPQEPVRQHAARARQVVDELAGGDHLVGRQRVLVPVAAGHAADDRHHRVAVAEDLLDVVRPVQELHHVLVALGLGPEQPEEALDGPAVLRVVVPLARDVNVVRLHVEDELVLGPVLLERLRVIDLLGRRPRSNRRRPG